MTALRPLLIAIAFLTRLPVPSLGRIDDEESGASLVAYPLVGAIIGTLLILMAFLTQALPALLTAALVVVIWALLTGALHLDGLADSADAWVGGMAQRERTLEIMKDPSCGPIGVTAIVAVFLLKVAAVAALLDAGAVLAIATAAVVGRAGLTLLFLTTPYVRPGGIGEALSHFGPPGASLGSAAVVTALAALLTGWAGLAAVAAGAVALVLAQHAMSRRLGGTTGDTAGATVELTETAALLGAAAVAASV
ncbi:adenosylcobinamide-GDP ribazoletransferase [Halorhodospira sp. 9621]|uniref:adenosylcobinamide-GDP ribazoletransferase n=1 Tax=Halorhodospira sp. 9621 TaxID=2899135 RepID=UPI001EE7BC4A|nr:adenosylcobinamide-GDP ribazoletransferase [Halorhodospira sp. 9621]MCG5532704.1 adenosylcobinamide-GDP ribazoletransferase [Halorhodospira sp. 9621]